MVDPGESDLKGLTSKRARSGECLQKHQTQ
jgi:hypothetical protein